MYGMAPAALTIIQTCVHLLMDGALPYALGNSVTLLLKTFYHYKEVGLFYYSKRGWGRKHMESEF